jgi:hypothetical protein
MYIYIMTDKQEPKAAKTESDKQSFTTYVSKESIENCRQIAAQLDRSLAWVVDQVMKNVTIENFK